jgi:hypothetical protein
MRCVSLLGRGLTLATECRLSSTAAAASRIRDVHLRLNAFPPSYTAWMRTQEVVRDKALKMAADHLRQPQQQSLRPQSTLSRFGEPLPEAPVTGEVVTHDYVPVGAAAGTNSAGAAWTSSSSSSSFSVVAACDWSGFHSKH